MPRSINSTVASTCRSGASVVGRLAGAWRTAAALACGLAVLHGCRGADAVAGANATPRATSAAPVIESVTSAPVDTLTPGGVLIIKGRDLPPQAEAVTATLNGVPLAVRVAGTERIEAQIPATGFACIAGGTAQVVVSVGQLRVTRDLPWRSARRVASAPGQAITLSAADAACLEFTGAQDSSGAPVRYALTMVNGDVETAAAPAMLLRGVQPTAPASVADPFAAPAALAATSDAVHDHASLLARSATAAAVTPFRAPRSGSAMRLTRALEVGDTVTPRALYRSCQSATTVRARVVYAGRTALVLEDLSASNAGRHAAAYAQLGDEFERVMLPLLQRDMGDPLATEATLGGDGRVTLLFTRFVNDSLPGTAGYVHACNLYAREQFAASNQDALLYLRVPSTSESVADYRRALRSTLVHEGKHLASFAERLAHGRTFEEPWLEEATARVAEELYARTFAGVGGWQSNTGFGGTVECELLACDDRPLIMWKHFAGLHAYLREMPSAAPFGATAPVSNASYAAGWSLVRWVLDHRVSNETAALRTLVSGQLPAGLAGLAQLAGVPSGDMLGAWSGALTSGALVTNAGDLGGRDSWALPDMLGGLSNTFGDAFARHPLPVQRATVGNGETVLPSFRGAARTTVVTTAAGASALLAVTPVNGTAPTGLRLVVQRLP